MQLLPSTAAMQRLPGLCQESWLMVVTTLALVLYGVLQERMMTRGWGLQQELFPFSSFLVLSNRLLTVLLLVGHSLATRQGFMPVAPLRSYCLVSLSNMVSTLCQYEALKYVSFVAQTLAKTAKALPVVLWATIFGGKRYSARQYAHAILVTGGCSIFVLGGDITRGSAARDDSWRAYCFGGCLLLAYLAADGWTSTQQETLYKTHATPIREQLLYTTAFSTLYSLGACVASGQLVHAVGFLQRHPDAALAVLSLSLASSVIQMCISSVLQRHGALMFALMMTSRQCVSVLLSTLLFGHTLSLSQWCGICVAFTALYHQRTSGMGSSREGGSRDRAGPQSRSRLAVSSAPQQQQQQQRGTHAWEGDPAGQPMVLVSPQSTAPSANKGSRLAYRGSHAGSQQQPHTAVEVSAAAAGAGVSDALISPAAARPAAAAAAVRSPALMGPWPTGSSTTAAAAPAGSGTAAGSVTTAAVVGGGVPSGQDPHLVAVVEVQPGPAAAAAAAGAAVSAGGGGQQQVQHRHNAVCQQEGPVQHPAGMALTFPCLKPPAWQSASRSPAVSIPAPLLHQPPVPASVHLAEAGVPLTGKAVDLRSLWSRGTGRVVVDPTTAVAMDHRDK